MKGHFRKYRNKVEIDLSRMGFASVDFENQVKALVFLSQQAMVVEIRLRPNRAELLIEMHEGESMDDLDLRLDALRVELIERFDFPKDGEFTRRGLG